MFEGIKKKGQELKKRILGGKPGAIAKDLINDIEEIGKGPVITLPTNEDRVASLKLKLAEYQRRRDKHISLMDAYKAPEQWFDSDSEHKIAVLEVLLRDGKVNTWDLSRELAKREGFYLDAYDYGNACAVITDYCKTGGATVRGGTGLPKT